MPTDSHVNCRFYVKIGKLEEAVFTEMSGLQIETETTEYAEGGQNGHTHRLPGRMKIGNITLKHGMIRSNKLFMWCRDIMEGKIERQNMTVTMFDPKGDVIVEWDFAGAYPVKWSAPQFSADGKNVAVESLELAHDGLIPRGQN
jgi:phage tail-like protein